MNRFLFSSVVAILFANGSSAQQTQSFPDRIEINGKWGANVFAPDAPERKLRQSELQEKRKEVNRRDREAWAGITNRAEWEKFRDTKLALLAKSLGRLPEPPDRVRVVTTRKTDGNGFVVENIVYQSRPGLGVTANLYYPSAAPARLPGILIIHSHHNPKTQGELQDMGMTWARQGCYVLVPDQLGHGERRQHPFATEKDYPAPFKVGRQDYYFRYNVGAQLHLVGESLMGWMVWDMMRGIDGLLARPGIDRDRIAVMGSVAGGGDPAAVLAALDRRVAMVVPFNFGGPQPETKFPLPDNAEAAFNYMGGGSWESTRNLRLSGRDGFLPWLIVGSAAPRGLIYAHEFAWDAERDPAWKRLQKIYSFYGSDRLASLHGRGSVQGKPPESTHCNNIGPEHRKGIYPPLQKWLGIESPAEEWHGRLSADKLQCHTTGVNETFKPRPVWALADELASERLAEARARRAKLPPEARRAELQKQWAQVLGLDILRKGKLTTVAEGKWMPDYRWKTQIIGHQQEPYVAIPVLWLMPAAAKPDTPVVVAVAQSGKAGFLKHRLEMIVRLLQAGVAVCLPDLRGTGEMRTTGEGRGRTSSDTAISATEWMHGRTVLGTQVQEMLLVLDAVVGQGFGPIALWGDSFALVNPAGATLEVPYDADAQPRLAEPMGSLVALLAGLFAPETVRAIHVHGGLASYRSTLASPFLDVPHDCLVPGVLTMSDLDDVAAVWVPRPLSIEAAVDARNQRMAGKELAAAYALTRAAGGNALTLRDTPATAEAMAAWLTAALRK
jgi:dienelactone hydrolase